MNRKHYIKNYQNYTCMIKQKFTQGFTLIELLVVIAIIGILASVVLASLNTARDKGRDAAARSDLNNMRAQAQIIYDNTGSYDTVCEDQTILAAVTNAGALCVDSTTVTGAYAMAVDLIALSGTNYCVDSTNTAKDSAIAASIEVADGVCDGN